jgi:hypothetical protein
MYSCFTPIYLALCVCVCVLVCVCACVYIYVIEGRSAAQDALPRCSSHITGESM